MKTPHKTLLVALVCIGLLAAPAAAGLGGAYKGKTEQNRPVTFKVAKGKVKGFTAGINVFCIGEGIKFNAVIPPKALKVRDKKFSYKGRDRVDSSDITINGRFVRGGKVKGKVSMISSTSDSSSGFFVSCSGEAKFTAKKKR